MEPEASSAIHQGRKQHGRDTTQKSVSEQDIPEDLRALQGAPADITEGALPEGQTRPQTSRLADRPSARGESKHR